MALGREIAGELRPPQWILLVGDLGAGKTTLTKGLIAGLGSASADEVLSPTFSLIGLMKSKYRTDPGVGMSLTPPPYS